MKRRIFIQSLAAVFALPAAPALSLSGASAAAPTAAVAVPTQARFWAIYMSALHGECTPQTLTNLLHIPETDAKRYVGQLIADGVIKPNPLLQNTVSELVKPKDDSLIDKAKKRLEKKSEAQTAARGEAGAETHQPDIETDTEDTPIETADLADDDTQTAKEPDDSEIEHSALESDMDGTEDQPRLKASRSPST